MNPLNKGQTALEYLLILVVAIIVVVAVMVYMQSASSANIASGTQSENNALCRTTPCITAADCISGTNPNEIACNKFSIGTCVGATNIGGTPIAGSCQPGANAVYTANPTAAPAGWA